MRSGACSGSSWREEMRWCGVLFLLVTAFVLPLTGAEGNAEGLASPTDNNSTASSVMKMIPPDATNATDIYTKASVQDKGPLMETAGNNAKGDSKDRTPEKKDELRNEPKTEEGAGKWSSDGQTDSKAQSFRDSYVEECDPTHRCFDEKKKFTACLRVPGEDSLDLSLLIENRGATSLDVTLEAPDFVNLEQSVVRLKAKENKEVKVSVTDGSNDSVIILKTGEGHCNLSLRNTDSHAARESSRLSTYVSRHTQLASICMLLAALSLLGAACSCIKLWRMRSKASSPTYQKVDMELPVSSGGKKEADQSNQWDNSWGDGSWDDEEASLTPLKPVTNLSSKVLASRRLAKDGWKDQ